MFYSVYSVSLCCSVYCLYVNVYCTAATGCQLQLTNISYHIISLHSSILLQINSRFGAVSRHKNTYKFEIMRSIYEDSSLLRWVPLCLGK